MSLFRRRLLLSALGTNTEPTPVYTSSWTVENDGQWEDSMSYASNATHTTFRVFESSSNYNKSNSMSKLRITIMGLPNFYVYINSYAESNYDYTIAFNIDTPWNSSSIPSYTSSGVKEHTRGFQYTPTGTISDNWKRVDYTNDGGLHTIDIVYIKDGSANSGNDRGYVMIPRTGDNNYWPALDTILYYAASQLSDVGYGTMVDLNNTAVIGHTFSNGVGNLICSKQVSSLKSNLFNNAKTGSTYSLVGLRLPKGVSNIGDYCMANQSNLIDVYIFSTVGIQLGHGTFLNCPNLESVYIASDTIAYHQGTTASFGSFCNSVPNDICQTNGCELFLSTYQATLIKSGYEEMTINDSGYIYYPTYHQVYSKPSYNSGAVSVGPTNRIL